MIARLPVYPAMAIEINPIEIRTSDTRTAGIAVSIRIAKNVIDPLRAMGTGHPRLSSTPHNHPPSRLPTPATMNGIHPNFPMDFVLKWRAFLRYSGYQKM